MATYESTAGSIVHVELNTTDPDATRAFYADAFDWQFDYDEPNDYTMWRAPNPPNGGLMTDENGELPDTVFYLEVDDLATARDAVEAAGGTILEREIEVPEMGLLSIFRAPGGTVEAMWEDTYEGEPPEGGWPQFTDDPELGSITHFELYSDDPDATRAFHEEVFDWQAEEVDGYTMLYPPTPPYGGIMQTDDDIEVGTLLYLRVDAADAALETIQDAGGEVVREPFDVEDWGRMAVFEAPGGVTGAIWQGTTPAEDEPTDEPERTRSPST